MGEMFSVTIGDGWKPLALRRSENRGNVNEVNMSQIRERTQPFRHTRESGSPEGSLYSSLLSQGKVWIPASARMTNRDLELKSA